MEQRLRSSASERSAAPRRASAMLAEVIHAQMDERPASPLPKRLLAAAASHKGSRSGSTSVSPTPSHGGGGHHGHNKGHDAGHGHGHLRPPAGAIWTGVLATTKVPGHRHRLPKSATPNGSDISATPTAEPVVCVVRVRPPDDHEDDRCIHPCEDTSQVVVTGITRGRHTITTFTFARIIRSDGAFAEDDTGAYYAAPLSHYADQRDVHEQVGLQILKSSSEGFNVCIMAHGETGAGKTFTLVGTPSNPGLLFRLCRDVFQRLEHEAAEVHCVYEVGISVVMLFKSVIQDLLEDPARWPAKGLEVHELPFVGAYVKNLSKRLAATFPDCQTIFTEAHKNKATSMQQVGSSPNRGHMIYTIVIKRSVSEEEHAEDIGEPFQFSSIHIVDLAGYDRHNVGMDATPQQMKEHAAINKSLIVLGQVIEKLAQKSQDTNNKKHIVIPYRDSKLTRLLQHALGGSSKTWFLACVSPSESHFDSTLATLKYCERASKVKNMCIETNSVRKLLQRQLNDERSKLRLLMEMAVKKREEGHADEAEADHHLVQKVQAEISRKEAALFALTGAARLNFHHADAEHKPQDIASQWNEAQSDALPFFASLSSNPKLIGKTKYEFPDGLTLRFGRCHYTKDHETDSIDSGADEEEDHVQRVILVGNSFFHNHVEVTNTGGRCYLSSQHPSATKVNGTVLADMQLSDSRIQLNSGDIVLFGSCGFVFIDSLQIHEPEVYLLQNAQSLAEASGMHHDESRNSLAFIGECALCKERDRINSQLRRQLAASRQELASTREELAKAYQDLAEAQAQADSAKAKVKRRSHFAYSDTLVALHSAYELLDAAAHSHRSKDVKRDASPTP